MNHYETLCNIDSFPNDEKEQALLDFLKPGTFASILPALIAGKKCRKKVGEGFLYIGLHYGSLYMWRNNEPMGQGYIPCADDLTTTVWEVTE